MSILIKNGVLVTQDKSRRVVEGNIYAEEGTISEMGPGERPADTVVDANGCIVIPGLINCFTTSAHVLLGPPTDLPHEVVRRRMEALRDNLTRRDVQMATALACAEMLRSGTTCFLDTFPWQEEVARAVTQVGMRGFLSWLISCTDEAEHAARYVNRVKGWDRVTPMVGAAGLTDTEVVETTASLAKENGIRWCLPVAESRSDVYGFQRERGERPGQWLEEKSLLSPDLIVLHGVWLTLNEIRALARHHVKVVHCPVSNQLKGVGGPAPVVELLGGGVEVGLGTDSSAVCGSLDLFDHMRACAALHKGQRWDPEVLPAGTIFDLATLGAAGVLGLDGGQLLPGKVADLVVLDPRTRGFPYPAHRDIISYLVHLAERSQVKDVVVAGELVVEDGHLSSMDVEPLRHEVTELREELYDEDHGD